MSAAELLREARRRAGLTQLEVARRAGTSQPNVNRTERGVSEPELRTLRRMLRACGFDVELRLIKKRRSRLADLVDSRRDAILEAAKRHGANHVRVFGSVARRSPRARDVDFLVSLEPGRDIVDLASLRDELGTLLDAPVDVTTLDLLRPEARREAAREAVPL